MQITIKSDKEDQYKKELLQKNDADSKRLVRYLGMPDLSRTPGSPINELVERIKSLPIFADLDVIEVPEIVPYDVSFDLFNFPPDHPARSRSDTYFLDDKNILRTHTTVMWYYYLMEETIKEKIKKGEAVGAFCHGKVYRKDEIDRNHMNVFHQIDGWYLCRKEERVITLDDLKAVETAIAEAIFGKNIKYRFNVDKFPYTDPSCEMEINLGGLNQSEGLVGRTDSSESVLDKWIEILGSGIVRGSVLEKLGVDPNIYNGWAFGMGIERLAIVSMELPDIRLLWSDDERVKKQLKLGNKFKEVSKFPPIVRDISFIVSKDFVPNNYFDVIRDLGGDLIEEVKLLDKYENAEKFGEGRLSYTYRIIYRSNERTLKTEEIDPIQNTIYEETKKQFNAEVR